MSKTATLSEAQKPQPTTDEKLNWILKLLPKVIELLEEQVSQQAEILDQLKNRDLIGEDFSVTGNPDFEVD